MAKSIRVEFVPGVKVKDSNGLYLVVDILDAEHVLIEDAQGRRDKRHVRDLQLENQMIDSSRPADLWAIPQDTWNEMQEIAAALEPLLRQGPRLRTLEEVKAVAEKLGKHHVTIYRWLQDYEKTGNISSLLRKPRSDKKVSRLSEQVDAVIKECIDSFYLTSQRRSVAKTAKEIKKRCKTLSLTAPHPDTVRARILAIDEAYRVRRREGYKAADEQFSPIYGSFPDAEQPLAVVQIDHTPMDVIAVDDVHRLPINRCYLTIAIDVYSKMIVGFYISLDAPGALATGLTISRAICGKEKYLKTLGLDDLEWPCWGLMRVIHTDNAKEFRGTMLGRAAAEYGILAQRRPKGRPRYGGHVERAFRTYMTEVHEELPGTTFSNPKQRIEYDSEGKAVMTLDALEKWFTLFLLGVYHQSPHDGNDGLPPIVKWERGIFGDPNGNNIPRGIPARYPDEHRLYLDFLPFVERTVQEYGIVFEGIYYWHDALRQFIHAKDLHKTKLARLFICRYDPRDLSKLHFYDPDNRQYLEVPYRNLSRAPISIWEVRQAKRLLREDSRKSTNEELIFKTIDRMRKLVDEESEKSKTARRQRQRQKGWERQQKKSANPSVEKKAKHLPPTTAVVDDLDDIQPYGDIREA